MNTELRQVISGSFCSHVRQIVDKDGNRYDFRNSYLTPQKHHRIIETADGYKLALNPHNDICYKIVGEKY